MHRSLPRILPLLLLFILAHSCAEPLEGSLEPVANPIDPEFSHAYLVTEQLAPGLGQLQHVELTADDVFDGTSLAGTTRALRFSFVHDGPLPAGTYKYQLGQNYGDETVDFFDLEYFERYNFSVNQGGSLITPFNAVINVDYEGDEMRVSVNTEINSVTTPLASFRGEAQVIDTDKFYTDLALPAAGAAQAVFSGERSFEPTYALRVQPLGRFGNAANCFARLILTDQERPTGNVNQNMNYIEVVFGGRGLMMNDGLLRMKEATNGYSDRYGLSVVQIISNITTNADDEGGEFSSESRVARGDAIAYVQDGFLVVQVEGKDRDGSVVKATYSGPLDELEQVLD